MYFMLELPTNKYTQDFNHTRPVGPQELNVFTDNISFYFDAIISIKKLIKQSHNGVSQLFQHGLKMLQVFRLNMSFKMQNVCFSTWSFST